MKLILCLCFCSVFLIPSHLWSHFPGVYLSESFMKTATKEHNCLYIFVMRICAVFLLRCCMHIWRKSLSKWICAQEYPITHTVLHYTFKCVRNLPFNVYMCVPNTWVPSTHIILFFGLRHLGLFHISFLLYLRLVSVTMSNYL